MTEPQDVLAEHADPLFDPEVVRLRDRIHGLTGDDYSLLGLIVDLEAALLRAALVRTPETLDAERARQAFHVEYEWQDIGCQHKNQYPKTWDCHKRVIEFAEVYNAAAPTPETET